MARHHERIVMTKKTILTFIIFFVSSMVIHADETPQQFQGFNLEGFTQNGQKSWDVTGETANIMGSLINLTNIVANAYGDQQMNLTAQNGTIDQTSGQMHLEKDVVITTQTGTQMTTDSLDWNREKDLVRTDDEATITNKDLTATGTGIIAHPNLKTAQMNEDVTVKVKTEPEALDPKVVTITCDGPLEIDQAKSMAVFNKNVVAVQEGRTLKADKIEMYFDAKTNKIKEMVCTGNVSIIQGQNTTYSESAIYKAGEEKLILSGRPKLILFTGGDGLAPLGN